MKYEYTRTHFTPEYEEQVRRLTNPNGRGNAAYDPDAERAMLAQDVLVHARMWFHGATGFSAEFRWASGRQDGFVVLDVPSAPESLVAERAALVERLKRQHQEPPDDRPDRRAA